MSLLDLVSNLKEKWNQNCMCPVQKSLLDPLELELKAVVSHHADAETQTQVLWENNQGS